MTSSEGCVDPSVGSEAFCSAWQAGAPAAAFPVMAVPAGFTGCSVHRLHGGSGLPGAGAYIGRGAPPPAEDPSCGPGREAEAGNSSGEGPQGSLIHHPLGPPWPEGRHPGEGKAQTGETGHGRGLCRGQGHAGQLPLRNDRIKLCWPPWGHSCPGLLRLGCRQRKPPSGGAPQPCPCPHLPGGCPPS